MRAKPFRGRERLSREDPPLADRGDASSGALRIIDRALRELAGRRLVSSAEVVDLLLDLRSAIILDTATHELYDFLGWAGNLSRGRASVVKRLLAHTNTPLVLVPAVQAADKARKVTST